MKRFYFEMQVKGTATAYADANSKEEAYEKVQEGKWVGEEDSQETEWTLGSWGNVDSHLTDIGTI